MRRRVPLQKLRGSDPTLLEIQIQDLLGRPSGQLEPLNLCDLFALSELEEPPRAIRGELAAFVKRCSAEIAEIPDGSSMVQFATEFAALEPSRVPQSFRDLVLRLTKREGRDATPLRGLLEAWSDGEPEPFVLGAGQVRVQRAGMQNSPKQGIASRTRPRERSASKGSSTRSTPSASSSKPVMDIDRRNWIADVALERLGSAVETGLGEAVLIAGITHRAKTVYPHLAPHEITMVLNELLKGGRVRKSAGRWSRTR
ncbi:MAG: hypothetical protein R3F61_16850 [Myxococcota bacterium]